jgi:pheromone shutdown-related protein TraB
MENESADISRVNVGDREIVIIGTAHISQRSVDLVRETIEAEAPDCVCVEIDEQRYEAMVNPRAWESLNLIDVMKRKQTTFLIARLALTAFQKRMSSYTGVKPGAEMLAAVECAEEREIPIVLADRDIRTTLLRAWRTTPFWKRSQIAVMLVLGLTERSEVNEDELEKLREERNISNALDEMGSVLPEVKSVLVDERDLFMADQFLNAPGQKVVAVVGAAHKPGIMKHLRDGIIKDDVEKTTYVPEKSMVSKALPWIIPAIVVALFVLGGIYGDHDKLKDAALAWLVVNGALAGLGALVALAHPLTIIAAVLSAPFTSLNPAVGVGMVAGLVQTIMAAPTMRDMEHVAEDIVDWKGYWKNRLTRVLMVFVFTNLGSTLGTFIAFKWLSDLF